MAVDGWSGVNKKRALSDVTIIVTYDRESELGFAQVIATDTLEICRRHRSPPLPGILTHSIAGLVPAVSVLAGDLSELVRGTPDLRCIARREECL